MKLIIAIYGIVAAKRDLMYVVVVVIVVDIILEARNVLYTLLLTH